MHKPLSLDELIEISKKEINNIKELDNLGGQTVTWFELFLRVNSESEERCYKLEERIKQLEDKLKVLENRTSYIGRIG